jgi:hypothetical protein
MFKNFRRHCFSAFVLLMSSSKAFGEDVDAMTSFGDWSVFSDGESCWVAASLRGHSGDFSHSDLFTVSFFDRSGVPEMSVFVEEFDDPVSTVTLILNGNKVVLDPEGDFFFLEDDAETEILGLMLSGTPPSINIELVSGGSTNYDISLNGFMEAYMYSWRACVMRRY